MYIASASTTVKFHEFPNGKVIHHYQPGSKVEGCIRSISWSKDGNWLALVPYSGLTEIISVKDQLKLLHSIPNVAEPSCAVFQNNTKKNVALGTKNGQVLIYDIKSRSTKKRFPRASSMVTHVEFTAKDTHCVAACSSGEVLLYSNTTNNVSSTFKIPKSSTVTALRTHAQKRNLILAGSNEGIVVVWDINMNKVKFNTEAHNAPVTSVAFSPINAVMVLTTGLDRRLCMYDIESHQRIAGITVDNSVTAVDFLDDATYFGTASQNGKVLIYDTRYYDKPVYFFEAHNSTIKHLSFQKQPDDSLSNASSSLCSMNSESFQVPTQDEEVDRPKRTSDIFGYLVQGPAGGDAPDMPSFKQNTTEGGDSFMAALGLDRNDTMDSCKPEESAVQEEDVRRKTPNPTKKLHDKIGLVEPKNILTTSTPKVTAQSFANMASPIVSFTKDLPVPAKSTTIAEDVLNVTRTVVKEEIKNAMEDITTKMNYEVMFRAQQIRQMILDLQMSMVRESIKTENHYNGIREEFNVIREEINLKQFPGKEHDLVEENACLRRRIMFLEEQIANLTMEAQKESESI